MGRFQKRGRGSSMRALLLAILVASVAASPMLIVRKKILEYPAYVSRDVTVTFRLYNVGTSDALNVELQDVGYDKLEQWTAHVGSHKATWKAIPAGTNVTHTFVIKPKRATEKSDPYYSYPAVATYAASIEGERLTAYSNDVGAFHIYQRGELSKKAKNSLTSWCSCSLVCPSLRCFRSPCGATRRKTTR